MPFPVNLLPMLRRKNGFLASGEFPSASKNVRSFSNSLNLSSSFSALDARCKYYIKIIIKFCSKTKENTHNIIFGFSYKPFSSPLARLRLDRSKYAIATSPSCILMEGPDPDVLSRFSSASRSQICSTQVTCVQFGLMFRMARV